MAKLIPKNQKGGHLYKQDQTQTNNQDKFWGIQRSVDANTLEESQFNQKYKQPLHTYKWNNDQQYKQQLINNQKIREQEGRGYKVDLPSTDIRSKSYAGNSNLKFLPGNNKGDSKSQQEQTFLSTTTATAPILPLKALQLNKAKGLIKHLGKSSKNWWESVEVSVEKPKLNPERIKEIVLQERQNFIDNYLRNPEFQRRMSYFESGDQKALAFGDAAVQRTPFEFVPEFTDGPYLGKYYHPTSPYNMRQGQTMRHINPSYNPSSEKAAANYGKIQIPLDRGGENTIGSTTFHELIHSVQHNHEGFKNYLNNNNPFKDILKPEGKKIYDLKLSNSPQRWSREGKEPVINWDEYAQNQYYKADPEEIHAIIVQARKELNPNNPFQLIEKKSDVQFFKDKLANKIQIKPVHFNNEAIKQLLNKLAGVTLPSALIKKQYDNE